MSGRLRLCEMRAALISVLVLAAAAPTAAGARLEFFRSPSGNISCYLDARNARCDIADKEWTIAKRPKGCPRDIEFGQGLTVSSRGSRGQVVCAGDTALGAKKVLAYGRSLTVGRLKCTSRRSGMTCRNRGGHGFRISRTRHDLF